jgi:hypothetical protein
MNSYRIDNISETVSSISAKVVLTAMLLGAPAIAGAVAQVEPINFKASAYHALAAPSTYAQLTSVFTGEFPHDTPSLTEAVADFYAMLLSSQERLEPEFELVLHENLWDLYES